MRRVSLEIQALVGRHVTSLDLCLCQNEADVFCSLKNPAVLQCHDSIEFSPLKKIHAPFLAPAAFFLVQYSYKLRSSYKPLLRSEDHGFPS